MSMQINELTSILKKISNEHDDDFDIDVTISNRFTTTLGQVKITRDSDNFCIPVEMRFSQKMLDTATKDAILSVVRHEWAHYYLTKTTNVDHGHDIVFKSLCAKLGCNGMTHVNLDKISADEPTGVPTGAKYSIYCAQCGQLITERTRRCKTVTNPEAYHSVCCHAALKVVQNY